MRPCWTFATFVSHEVGQAGNPLVWRRQYRQGRAAGALADWLHNLAQYAATDFRSFDTDWFWHEYAGVCRDYPDLLGPGKWMDYRDRYEKHLAKQNAPQSSDTGDAGLRV
jgi:hypothetical protein